MSDPDPIVQAVAEAMHADSCPDDECDGSDMGGWDRQAEVAVAAARPLIAAEALREAADLIGGSSGPRHGVKMPDEQEWAQWLYDHADRIEESK